MLFCHRELLGVGQDERRIAVDLGGAAWDLALCQLLVSAVHLSVSMTAHELALQRYGFCFRRDCRLVRTPRVDQNERRVVSEDGVTGTA